MVIVFSVEQIVFCHEGGYSTLLVPYCGLAVLEVLTGHDCGVPLSAVVEGDPPSVPLHDHERNAVAAAAANVVRVPRGS